MRTACAVAALIACLPGEPATALEVQTLEATWSAPSYRVSLVALIDASPEKVAAVLLDYDAYPQLDPRIRRSESQPGEIPGVTIMRTRVRFCAGLFCRTIDRVEEVRHADGELVATVIPERSDLHQGRIRVTWRAEGQQTLVTYDAEFTPAFWVPRMIARRYAPPELRDATLTLFTNVERVAHDR
jgi:hypothetical protein